MTEWVEPDVLNLAKWIKPGDGIVSGQACGEPSTLFEALIAQRHDLGGVSLFAGSSFSGMLKPEHCDAIKVFSMGAIGTLRKLSAEGLLGIIPCHVGQISTLIKRGAIACDVAFIQVSPADADGNHSMGLIADYVGTIVETARVVIAEVNHRVPRTVGERTIPGSAIDVAIETDRDPVSVPEARIGDTDSAIAGFVAKYIEDGSIIQVGIGAVPDAITKLIGDRQDLGIHSGMIGDGVVDLIESGVVTNATHGQWQGMCVTGALIGSERLYRFAHENPVFLMCGSGTTHDDAVLCGLEKLVSINSAIEVDLTGQVNAETVGSAYVGGTGGQVDYVRGASRSHGGRSIIALPATAKTASRIVSRLSGPVTTARSEIDVVVTEYGAAELSGLDLAARARAMIAIAHPDMRAGLEEQAHDLLKRGF
ncbi:acetyl-CoA hydrolase [Croceicoccus estronivorus]|uniref:acetyl-CoA hydrolase/transferase family protein n=1 Tax=Croceicoccus estronivorus TaxID=1172626 RepID=UPI00083306B9|nr:acetyl-CoA hydrolase/transferase C-terminal domain-containing protein [Croceicoccus estronivorus]OCC23394.1 acetyl-CoA hydrolase [Croceicoccus estronivorus]